MSSFSLFMTNGWSATDQWPTLPCGHILIIRVSMLPSLYPSRLLPLKTADAPRYGPLHPDPLQAYRLKTTDGENVMLVQMRLEMHQIDY